MGKAGYVLKQVLEQYNITQYRLAANLGIDRTAEVRGSNPLFSILENTSNYVDGRLRGNPLEDLATAKAQAVLHGDSPFESRSHSLTFALREFYGWENWAAQNRVPISGHA
jgi:transcriptional regulator with XRE-family HTH domain